LEEQLDHGTKTYVYVTAAQTSGFPPHYDTHDILLLQNRGQEALATVCAHHQITGCEPTLRSEKLFAGAFTHGD